MTAETTDADTIPEGAFFHRAPLIPIEWGVTCPVCETVLHINAHEDNGAVWRGTNEDQFPECRECGSLIEVTPVYIKDSPFNAD